MKISSRLQTIGDFVNENASVIDVGADHGLLEKYLLSERKVKSIQAIENKKGPYEILKNNLKGYNIDVILSNGLDSIKDDVDTIVIAGMGGYLIKDILTKDVSKLKNIKHIVVDAHRETNVVRECITSLGFKINKEKIIHENDKYYIVISFSKGKQRYSEDEIEFGYLIAEDPLFDEYRQEELDRLVKNLIHQRHAKILKPNEIEKLEDKIERLAKL